MKFQNYILLFLMSISSKLCFLLLGQHFPPDFTILFSFYPIPYSTQTEIHLTFTFHFKIHLHMLYYKYSSKLLMTFIMVFFITVLLTCLYTIPSI
jgi:hypothetical protein